MSFFCVLLKMDCTETFHSINKKDKNHRKTVSSVCPIMTIKLIFPKVFHTHSQLTALQPLDLFKRNKKVLEPKHCN